jgi:hypothetical protein
MTGVKQIRMMCLLFFVGLSAGAQGSQGFPPLIDLNDRSDIQVVVDREKGQYLGHPTTVLLEDGKTMYCVYPRFIYANRAAFGRRTAGNWLCCCERTAG